MNRYPLWKYILIVVALILGALYAVPNKFGESPALQISSGRATFKVTPSSVDLVEQALKKGGFKPESVYFDMNGSQGSVRARFADTTQQFEAKSFLDKELNVDPADQSYLIAFNMLTNTPKWLQALHAFPMNKGLDLRGGVHFLEQVDVKGLINKKMQGMQSSVRTLLRDKNVRHAGIERNDDVIEIKFRDQEARAKAREVIVSQMPDLLLTDAQEGDELKLVATLRPQAAVQAKKEGVQQNIIALGKRINALGVSEPLIQQQGNDRIIVELAGYQDVAKAKEIIGRTATLEVRMVDESVTRGTALTAAIPYGSELFKVGKSGPVVLSKEAVITGDYISNATAGLDENQQPEVSITLNGDGGRKMREATRNRVGKGMAIVLFEKSKGEVLSVATIQSELGSSFRITGMGSVENSTDLALLLRAGSLAADMQIIEERTIGPQLGAENIEMGFKSTLYGFAAIAVFMAVYYMLFGFFSVFALLVNLLLLVAMLSGLQATLTLPGIAAIAFTLGMAIDSNVLINERIREELRAGNSPQAAITAGFDRAWATILDSNVTTFIAGASLWIWGSGPIRGFATVHCLGIVTSIFSSVFVSRGVVNLWYGRRKKLTSLSIGQIWKPSV